MTLDLFVLAFALMLVIEGALYALFPDFMRRVLAAALMAPIEQMRLGGVTAVIVGVGLVWIVKVL